MAVSFTDWVKPHLAVMRFDYSEVLPFVLATPCDLAVGQFPISITRQLRQREPSLPSFSSTRLHYSDMFLLRRIGSGQKDR
jgi:hypothetical protein